MSPTFDTDLSFKHYVKGECNKSYAGTFEDAFINEALLDDASYLNKYNAFLHGGYVENIIENRLASNDLKVLFVGHSYGRYLVQYLSLHFAETRYLDPQNGRYNDNYIAYVEDYQPDIVIVMYAGSFNVE